MAEYSDFLYYTDKHISTGANPDSQPSVAPQHAPIHITLPPLKRPQSPPSATSPPFSFQTTNFYAQHINELASSPPSKTHMESHEIEMQPVVDQAKEPAVKSDPKEALKRCKNCGRYYKERDNVLDTKSGTAPCRYHPGKYQSPITSQHMGSFPMWSCCKNDENAPGCRVQYHVIDVEASKSLTLYDELRRTFGQSEQVTDQDAVLIDFTGLGPVPGVTTQHGTQSKHGDTKPAHDKPSDTTRKSRAPVRVSSTQLMGTELIHYVKMSDTLYGLALKYDVTVADIKAANKMTSDNIFAYSQLVIPRKPEEVEIAEEVSQEDVACQQAQMVNRFKRTQRVSNEEALYYLDICEWNYEEAVKEREEDLKFETAVGGRQAQKVQ